MRDPRVPVLKNGPAISGRFFHSGFEHAVRLFCHFSLLGRLGGIVVAVQWESEKRMSVFQAQRAPFPLPLLHLM
jgi:hypothetical protein